MTGKESVRQNLWGEIQRCVDLFNSQVFVNRQLFTQSAFVEILVRLNFVLQKLSDNNNRVAWADDIQIGLNIKDITDLVNNLRNAACHSDSPRNYINNSSIKFVFNIFSGKNSHAFEVGKNIFLGNDYQDDTAFYYGDKRIYLNRHIKRLLEELPGEINKLK